MKTAPSVWTGRVLSGLFVLFMLAASIAPKFLMADMVAEQSMTPLGWPAWSSTSSRAPACWARC